MNWSFFIQVLQDARVIKVTVSQDPRTSISHRTRIQRIPILLTALANVLENTALFGEFLLRLSDITHEVNKRYLFYSFKGFLLV